MSPEEARERLAQLKKTNPKRYEQIKDKFNVTSEPSKRNIKFNKGLKNITSQFQKQKTKGKKEKKGKGIGFKPIIKSVKAIHKFVTPKIKQFTPEQLRQQVPQVARTRTTLEAPDVFFRNPSELDRRLYRKKEVKNLFFK